MLLLRSIFAILFTQKIGQALSTSPVLPSCFHRRVFPANKGRNQVYRENREKIKITYKAIPYQSFIKIVQKNYFAQPFPTRDRKNKQIKSGPRQLATVPTEPGKIGLLPCRNLPDPSADLYPLSLPYVFTLEKATEYFVCSRRESRAQRSGRRQTDFSPWCRDSATSYYRYFD